MFKPDLAPLGTLSVSIWSETENAMGSTTLAASPYGGYELPAEGIIIPTVMRELGAGTCNPDVPQEASTSSLIPLPIFTEMGK